MKYLLDTNICIYWLNGRQEIMDEVIKLNNDELVISIITLAELKYGAYNSAYVNKNLQKVEEFESAVDIINICKNCVDLYARIKSKLKAEGRILDDFDILIAATAIVNNCVLVSNNIKHFERIPDLNIENWIK